MSLTNTSPARRKTNFFFFFKSHFDGPAESTLCLFRFCDNHVTDGKYRNCFFFSPFLSQTHECEAVQTLRKTAFPAKKINKKINFSTIAENSEPLCTTRGTNVRRRRRRHVDSLGKFHSPEIDRAV